MCVSVGHIWCDLLNSVTSGMLYMTVKSYKATKDDEISLAIGSVVEVLQKSDSGWWLIRYNSHPKMAVNGAKNGVLERTRCSSDPHHQHLPPLWFIQLSAVHCPLLNRYNSKVGYIPTMYLKPYNSPQIRINAGHHSPAAAPSGFQQQCNKLSSSQGNLLQLPSADRVPSPQQPRADGRQRSHSLNTLHEMPPAPPARAMANDTGVPSYSTQAPPPMIMVEMDGAGCGRSPTVDSEGSFLSDSTDFSDSEELESSWGSSMLNLSANSNGELLLRSRTPPPPSANHLSPNVPGCKMIPSLSDPSIYKGPLTPKVPPRPHAQEILTRCTTITRKNASRGTLSPTQTEILSR